MTPSGDEPQLGGQPADRALTDLSPMISSVQTRVIASTRGAYAARNLLPLLKAMTPEQWQGFRVLLVRQALRHTGPILMTAGGHIEHTALDAASRWLDRPNPVRAEEARLLYFGANPLTGPLDTADRSLLIRSFARSAAISLAGSVWQERRFQQAYAAISAIAAAWLAALLAATPDAQISRLAALQYQVREWEVEAAWAILQGGEPPPLEMTS